MENSILAVMQGNLLGKQEEALSIADPPRRRGKDDRLRAESRETQSCAKLSWWYCIWKKSLSKFGRIVVIVRNWCF